MEYWVILERVDSVMCYDISYIIFVFLVFVMLYDILKYLFV